MTIYQKLTLLAQFSIWTIAITHLSGCIREAPPDITTSHMSKNNIDLVVLCGTLIDGLSETPMKNRMVIVQNERITGVVSDNARVPEEIPFLNLSAQTCLPGLINTHVHFDGNPEDSVDYSVYYRRTPQETLQLVMENARTTLMTGFTTVRHVGAWFPDAIYTARKIIEAGAAPGPRIQTAGPYLTIPGGGGDLNFPEIPSELIPAESQKGIASTPEGFAARAESAILAGADFLKVIASGAVFSVGTEPGTPEMSQEDIEAVVRVAKSYGKQVTAHVHSDQSGRDAILAGVDSLEHGSLLKDSTIRLARNYGVAFSMDVYNGTYTDTVGRAQGYPKTFLTRNTETTEAQRIVFEKAYAAGITLLYGTDASVLPHDMGAWQFEMMIERGMLPMDAIFSATSVAALHMGLGNDVGAITPGRFADLVAVNGNPLVDATVLRNMQVVIKGGEIVKETKSVANQVD